jgi:hypothetical protein
MPELTKKNKIVMINNLVRTLNRRRNMQRNAKPCDDIIKYIINDEDEQKEIALAKKRLIQLDKALDKILEKIRQHFKGIKDWSEPGIFFILVLLASVYSEMSLESEDIVELILRSDVSKLAGLNESIESGHLWHWVFREERYNKYRYSFYGIQLVEKFILN